MISLFAVAMVEMSTPSLATAEQAGTVNSVEPRPPSNTSISSNETFAQSRDEQPLPPPPSPLRPLRLSTSDAPWALPNSEPSTRTESTLAFSRAFHLTDFDFVDPVGPWSESSCGPFVAACLLEASRSQLTTVECLELQQDLNPDNSGTSAETMQNWLRQYWTVREVEPASSSEMVDQLHLGFPVIVTLNLQDVTHWVLITGYIASANGQIESWLLVDNGTSGGRMADAQFQDKWLGSTFKRHALLISPRHDSHFGDSLTAAFETVPFVELDELPYRLTARDRVQILLRNPVTGVPTAVAVTLTLFFGGLYAFGGLLLLADKAYQFVWLHWL